MSVTMRILATKPNPELVTLPWDTPLEEWPEKHVVQLPRGLSRHVVRFVRVGEHICAVKETDELIARREYHLLRDLQKLGLPPELLDAQRDPREWPRARAHLEAIFAQRPREEWCALLEGTDACFAPVLSFEEAMSHPHMRARRVFVEHAGVRRPAPAPRLSRTPAAIPPEPQPSGPDMLKGWGVEPA